MCKAPQTITFHRSSSKFQGNANAGFRWTWESKCWRIVRHTRGDIISAHCIQWTEIHNKPTDSSRIISNDMTAVLYSDSSDAQDSTTLCNNWRQNSSLFDLEWHSLVQHIPLNTTLTPPWIGKNHHLVTNLSESEGVLSHVSFLTTWSSLPILQQLPHWPTFSAGGFRTTQDSTAWSETTTVVFSFCLRIMVGQ